MSIASGAWPERGSCKVWGWQVFCNDFSWSSGHVLLVFLRLVFVRYLNLSLILSRMRDGICMGTIFSL
jgi:hypothetical protein